MDYHLHEQLKEESDAEGRILRDKANEALMCYLALPPQARQALVEAHRLNQQVVATVEHCQTPAELAKVVELAKKAA